MITPTQKAYQLFHDFYDLTPNEAWFNEPLGLKEPYSDIQLAKECALKCCDEVLGHMGADRGYEFWKEVKQEIEKL
jgi:hypothetical protein